MSGASCLAPGSSQGAIDAKLLTGAALFGLGWGTGGVCPGPQLVSLAAEPTAPGLLLMLAAVAVGIQLAGARAPKPTPNIVPIHCPNLAPSLFLALSLTLALALTLMPDLAPSLNQVRSRSRSALRRRRKKSSKPFGDGQPVQL